MRKLKKIKTPYDLKFNMIPPCRHCGCMRAQDKYGVVYHLATNCVSVGQVHRND